MLTIGSLCAGYGGLDMGVSSVIDAEPRWFAEFDPAPSKVLAHHWPHVPNLGDMTKIDWGAIEPVDVITGGTPCQDLSHAGKRQGMTDGTRSNLWCQMREAIRVIRPRLVVWENVRGALSAPASSDVESEPGLLGVRRDGPALRALGRVVGDLAGLGYVGRWYGLRAADVGAAHGRFRVFLFATPRDADLSDVEGLGSGRLAESYVADESRERGGPSSDVGGVAHVPGQLSLLPTPVSDNSRGLPSASTDYASLANVASLLPTPRATRGGSATETTDRPLPTPRTENNENRQSEGYGGSSGNHYGLVNGEQDWADYEPAIRRHEQALGRPAPAPTETGARGKPRLSPAFVEWLMMLPAGHVTDPAIGLTRNQQLKALGNGVVPAQAAAAFRQYLTDTAKERAA